jgi:hypothetical protein
MLQHSALSGKLQEEPFLWRENRERDCPALLARQFVKAVPQHLFLSEIYASGVPIEEGFALKA